MSEQILTVLKFCLLALLYLFLARVVWVVSNELRGTPAVRAVAAAPGASLAAGRPRRRAWRVVVTGPGQEHGRTHAVDGEATVGRGGGCTISLPSDTYVSQVHARLVTRGGDLWVEDLGSTNGTYVNGRRIEAPAKLRRGDRVQVGETVLEADR